MAGDDCVRRCPLLVAAYEAVREFAPCWIPAWAIRGLSYSGVVGAFFLACWSRSPSSSRTGCHILAELGEHLLFLVLRAPQAEARRRLEPRAASLTHEFGHVCHQGDQAGRYWIEQSHPVKEEIR
jgi:hypothetical protein